MDTTTESPPGNGNGVRQDADPETDRLGRGYPALDLLANGNPELGIIELTRGLVTIVDAEDFAWLSQWRWHAQGRDRWIYAVRSFIDLSGKPGLVLMHREIAGTGRGQSTDHINGDTLDNRRANLRTCSHSENMCNRRIQIDNASGFKGVYFDGYLRKFRARIQINGHKKCLGRFDTSAEAAAAYDRAAIELHGEFARTNATLSRQR